MSWEVKIHTGWWHKLHWLISDLIPKKSEKFEFRKNFVTIFFSVENWPKKWNFDFFCPRNFRKIAKLSSKFRSGIFTLKWKILEQLIFHWNQRKIAWTKKIKISFFGSVFDTEKYCQKIFPTFELFGFFRN